MHPVKRLVVELVADNHAFGQGLGDLLWQEVGAGGRHLGHLDEEGPELAHHLIDSGGKRLRPIASGRLKPKIALTVAAALGVTTCLGSLTLGDLFALAALTYLVMTIDVLAYWVTVFPEINLVVLGLIVALGRYTGLRLTELLRFRALAAEDVKP